ncbi:hypothetical protein [Bradyrhizobium diazoefficiens]|uniref:hypothetical protein n=1 Tax=Bradyrhizobium diazoefficiens TaxID=1355477 RepID=UPI001B6BF82A|nr:hypothetical protein [Bradyrhizobium japonicum]
MLQAANTHAQPPVFHPIASMVAPFNAAIQLWEDRQSYVETYRVHSRAFKAAYRRYPEWAHGGPRMIDHAGNLVGAESGYPLDTSVKPPERPGSYRVARPSLHDVKSDFEVYCRTMLGGPSSHNYEACRAKARARMRERMRPIIARLRERRRIAEDLGLHRINGELIALVDKIGDIEKNIVALHDSPDRTAALIMVQVEAECMVGDYAEGPGYCGTMAMAHLALRSLLPQLSGVIHEHAEFFVSNPTLAACRMPFWTGCPDDAADEPNYNT